MVTPPARKPRCTLSASIRPSSPQTFVAVADDNLDPCDLRIERGNEAVRSLIARAKPLYDFVIDAAISRFDLTYTPGQVGAMSRGPAGGADSRPLPMGRLRAQVRGPYRRGPLR